MSTRRDIIEIDLTAESDKYADLRVALSKKDAKIESSVSSGEKIVYVIESQE